MHYFIQWSSRIKYEKIAHLYPLGTLSAFHYMFYIFLGGVGTLNVKTVTNVTTATYVKNENAKCKNSTSYVKKMS